MDERCQSERRGSVYGLSPRRFSKQWWRAFIRQAAAAGYIKRTIKTAKFGQSTGVYASLSVTDVGRETVSKGDNVMLPKNSEQITEASIAASETCNSSLNVSVSSSQGTKTKTREGKGCHLLPLVKHLMQSKENWKAIITKENYHFLGTFTTPCQNFLWYTEDVTQLPHFTPDDPDFLWNDVQFSKGSSTKQLVKIDIGGTKDEKFWFRKSQCLGVKKCEQCEHVVSNSSIRNTCPDHPRAPLTKLSNCDVEFVYVCPENPLDNRRWIGGLLRNHNFLAQKNLHSHGTISSHKIPQKIRIDVTSAIQSNPTLKTSEISCGQGLSYLPAAADLSAAHVGRLNALRKQTLKKVDTCSSAKGHLALLEMEKIADRIDEEDKLTEGSESVSEEYSKRCRPYMRNFAITSSLIYQVIMTPLMSSVLANAEYIEVDTTYNENTDLPFLLNVTAFDYKIMRWVAVARVRTNKEDSEFYATAFKAIFSQCHEDFKGFNVAKNLRGIVLDWSDTERKGLELAVGKDTAEKLMIGCLVHYGRSYQRVADRVSASLPATDRKIGRDAFCTIARSVTSAKSKSDVLKLLVL